MPRRGVLMVVATLLVDARAFTTIDLLKPEEEVALGRDIQPGLEWEAAKKELAVQLERQPSRAEWAAHMKVDEDTLKLNMIRFARAKTTMISANLRLTMSIARRYERRGLALTVSDLVQEGVFRLMTAAERFDPDKGFRFSTYATWWIKAAIMRAIANQGRTIRLPVHVHNLLNSIGRATRELSLEFVRAPTDEELSLRLQVFTAASGSAASLGGKSRMTLEDSLHDSDSEPLPEDRAHQSMLRESVAQLLGTLSAREREVVRLRFGLDGRRARTHQEIGQIFRLSWQRVRQIEDHALQKLRQPYRNRKLHAHVFEGEALRL
ncbi:hypothetical protein JKP88DRAFT_323479 [Tribonema minus]|uniref:RNA polymerase sigma-70 domain-containing protein n=1 Tax=Tribonema minus TaxID=303371 RepID=A0A835YWC1_9STRA|nr:hypothetical protein JKP88DRAFT_323479 [Tribonema minus]